MNGPMKAFYASLRIITHKTLRTLKGCQCCMWNRYHPWSWAQNDQLTSPTKEEAAWPSIRGKLWPVGWLCDWRYGWLGQGRALVREGEKSRGGDFMVRKISSAGFADFGWESVGTFDASFYISLTFDLNVGFATPLSSTCQQSRQSLQLQGPVCWTLSVNMSISHHS